MLLGFLLLIIIAGVLILAIMGLGWQTFFGGVQKGAEKVGITKALRTLRTTYKNQLGILSVIQLRVWQLKTCLCLRTEKANAICLQCNILDLREFLN